MTDADIEKYGALPCGHVATRWDSTGPAYYVEEEGRTYWDGECTLCEVAIREVWSGKYEGALVRREVIDE